MCESGVLDDSGHRELERGGEGGGWLSFLVLSHLLYSACLTPLQIEPKARFLQLLAPEDRRRVLSTHLGEAERGEGVIKNTLVQL